MKYSSLLAKSFFEQFKFALFWFQEQHLTFARTQWEGKNFSNCFCQEYLQIFIDFEYIH